MVCRQGMTALLVGLAAWGCSKSDPPTPPSSVAPSSAATEGSAPAGEVSDSSAAAAPTEPPAAVATRFLDALRRGDKETVASLLTAAARSETVRLGYEINPPGDPGSKYEVGRVEMVAGPPQEAYVSSLWTHDLGNGEVFSYEAVWIARREPEGWRISGLAVSEPESESPLVFNFEKLDEVFEKKSQVEADASASDSARQAANPGAPQNGSAPLQ